MGGYWAFSAVFAEQFNEEGFPCGSDGKESALPGSNPGLIPGSGRSPAEGHSYPLQYSCLENFMTEEPGRLQSMRSQRISTTEEVTLSVSLFHTVQTLVVQTQ